MADLMLDLVHFVVSTDYEDLPKDVVDYAKKHILDTIGSIVAGSSAEGITPAVDLAKEWGGNPQASILLFGGKVPVPSAAFAIGPMARALDFGAVHSEANEHPNEYTFAAALPLAEFLRSSGRDLIIALALGNEIIVRIGASVHTITPVSMTKTHAVFRIWGPVAAAGKLLRLDEETMMNAMGLAFTQGGGDNQMYVDCVLKIRVQHGLVADTAIRCALLAQRGVTGTRSILQGDRGFYAAFCPQHDLTWVTDGLEQKEFKATSTRIKGYPTCTYTHSPIETAMCCLRENQIDAQHIVEIDVGINTPTYRQVCEPLEFRYNPRTPIDCQFSIPYTVACAVATGKVFIDDFTDEAIRRPQIRNMMRKVKCRIDPEIDQFCPAGFDGAKVTIRTKDGKEHYKRIDFVKGTPQNPMSFDEVVDKFRRFRIQQVGSLRGVRLSCAALWLSNIMTNCRMKRRY